MHPVFTGTSVGNVEIIEIMKGHWFRCHAKLAVTIVGTLESAVRNFAFAKFTVRTDKSRAAVAWLSFVPVCIDSLGESIRERNDAAVA